MDYNIKYIFKLDIIIKYYNIIVAHNIIIKYDKLYYTYINFLNKTILKYLLYV